jgi:hypothetical protein
VKSFLLIAFVLLASPLCGDEVVYPPLNNDTIAGTWEALMELHPATLWHMEINKNGESYMAQITVGSKTCIVRRLVGSDIKNGIVKLHFDKGTIKEMPNEMLFEVWLIGTGHGDESRGGIDAVFCGNAWPDSPPLPAKVFGVPEGNHLFFIKGAWTRDFAEASKIAEQSVKEQMSR